MEKKRLWNKDFTLVVIGQIISLFGNAILRFALPLYLLDITGSATIYGMVLAFSTIPMIILSPVGGIIADRVNKRNVMVVLDFGTASLILILSFLMGKVDQVTLILWVMIILYAIQGTYQPAVQASIPVLQETEHLLPANAVINQVSSISGLLGPTIGGILYGIWGLQPILIVGITSFFLSATLEIFIKIPYEKRPTEKNIFSLVKRDFSESITFMRKEKPIIWKSMCVVAVYNLFLTSMIMVGVPVMVTQILGLSSQLYGFAQGALMAGGVIGGLLVGILKNRVKIQNAYMILFGTSLTILPMGAAFLVGAPTMLTYIIIVICLFLFMMISTVFSVQMLAFIQEETPVNLIGKVISCVLMLSMCAQPIGNALYGVLFDKLADSIWIVMFVVLLISVIISLISKGIFTKIKK